MMCYIKSSEVDYETNCNKFGYKWWHHNQVETDRFADCDQFTQGVQKSVYFNWILYEWSIKSSLTSNASKKYLLTLGI